MTNPSATQLLAIIASLPPNYVFDEAALLIAVQNIGLPGPVTDAVLHEALTAAADAEIVREIEAEPGVFLLVRTTHSMTNSDAWPGESAGRPAVWPPDIPQPSRDLVGRALDVPVATVAIRRAILHPTAFTWSVEDYAALLDAAGDGGNDSDGEGDDR